MSDSHKPAGKSHSATDHQSQRGRGGGKTNNHGKQGQRKQTDSATNDFRPQSRNNTNSPRGDRVHSGRRNYNNKGNTFTPKKSMFEEYWLKEDVQAGLKRGTLIQGAIRINPKNYTDAYIPHPDGVSDIYVAGVNARNRSLNGDIVAVHIFPRDEWKVNVKELEKPAIVTDLSTKFSKMTVDKAVNDKEVKNISEGKADGDTSEQKVKVVKVDQIKKDTAGTSQEPSKTRTPNKSFTKLKDLVSGDNNVNNVVKQLFSSNAVEEDGDHSNETVKQQKLDAIPDNLLLRTGKVVYIIEKKHSRACAGHIKLMPDKNPNRALFCPTDYRIPRMFVPMSACPQGFFERPGDHAKTLFVARITEWDGNFAQGQIARSLGESGQIQPESEGMLIEYDIDFGEFPQAAIDCLPNASAENPWKIPREEINNRRDLRKECVFTIDPATARDLDDALHIIDLGNGEFEIGVHIADVSYFVGSENALDEVAASRATSVYLVQMVVPMLPRLLCEQLCSLNPDEDRLCLSVIWKMTANGEILDEWFGRTVIRSCVKLSYNHAQSFIEEPEREWHADELPPVSEGFKSSMIRDKVLLLNRVAKNLRKNRYDQGALSLNQTKLQYTLDKETGMPCGYSLYQQRDSNKLIEEFMLLANMAVAHKIYLEFPEVAVLRRHPNPQERALESTLEMLKGHGMEVDGKSSKSLQESLLKYTKEEDKWAVSQVLTLTFSKAMQLAKYFCTGCIDNDELYRHYALCVPLYTHFTSPIRRYPDIMVHRLLCAALGYNELPSRSKDELMTQCSHCNDKKLNAKTVGDLSSEMFFSLFVKECGPFEEKAIVIGILDKAVDVLILNLGVNKRIYMEQLPLEKFDFAKQSQKPSLMLTWKADGEFKSVRQTLEMFAMVNCKLVGSDEDLKWNCFIKHPQQPLVSVEIASKLPVKETVEQDTMFSYEDL